MEKAEAQTVIQDESLDALLAAFDRDRLYTTQELIKESDWERTERVIGPDNRIYIRKYLRLTPGETHAYSQVADLDCPFLPKIYKVDMLGDSLLIIMEYFKGNSLREHAKIHGAFDQKSIQRFLMGVIEGVKALHEAPGGPIIHRDINPGNIIITGGEARLVDFGIARTYKDSAVQDTHLWGTAGYAAPEQFGFKQSDVRTDIYALGMLLRFLFTGKEPHCAREEELPEGIQVIVDKATALDPANRYEDIYCLQAALVEFFAQDVAATPPHESSPFTTSSSAQDKLEEPFTACGEGRESRLIGLTRRYRSLKILWRIWQVMATICASALTISGFTIAATSTVMALPTRMLYVVMGIFLFVIPDILSTGLFGLTQRIAWFHTHRYRKIISCTVVSCLVCVIWIFVLQCLGFSYETG